MDKRAAISLIQDALENSFDKRKFAYLVSNMLDHIEAAPFIYRGNLIPDAYKPYISTLERIGKYKDREGNKIDLLIVRLKKETSLERARTMQRNFIAWYLNGSRGDVLKDAALAAFVSPDTEDWRFSLVKMDYRLDTSGEKVKVKKELTPARRFSFLVGKNENSHTAQSCLLPVLEKKVQDPTLIEIEKAFDIETVTKEFFIEYRELFLHTKEELDRVVTKDPKIKADFESKGVDAVNFAKKLLGQIIFLYFLQKKGWFGVGRDDDWGTGSKHFLRELFKKKHGDYNNFFNDILEPLFYEALRIDRSHDDGYYSRFNCKIPFLNGGLFDPIGNYDWVHIDIIIPDKLFSNNIKTKEGDTGTGILDVFDRYNFTVKEDEPLEKEVAIDPELLGKSYEKFNAIRPDNFDEFKKALKSGKKGEENKFNKKFGVYYTPREIVHYMCQQSLINYLATELSDSHSSTIFRHSRESGNPGVSKEDIEALIHTGEQVSENEARVLSKGKETKTYSHQLPDSIRKNAKLIDDKLAEITVCDPAVGSGAFPVGMMSEIVKTRNVLTPFLSLRGAQARKQSQFDDNRTLYNFKRQCIEHSLYGVDIDPGAVEIAKLRLWLSLVVDEDDIKNIKPLPNLDYKIMQGNSLIELLSTESLVSSIDQRRTELVKELKNAKDELFNITMPTQKENKRYEIDILMKKLFEYDRDKQIKRLKDHILAVKSQQRLFEDDKDKKEDEKKIQKIKSRIEEINIDVPGPTEHFEWHVNYSEIFQAKGGFDVVIANPPYGIVFDPISKYKYEKKYSTFLRNNDIYVAFYEQGISILVTNGSLIYISPNTFLNGDYFKKFRELLTFQTTINEITNYKEYPIFDDPTVFVCILNCTKRQSITYPYGFSLRIARNSLEDFVHKKVVINNASNKSFKPENQLLVKILKIDNVDILDNLFFVKDVGFNYWTKGRGKKRGGNSIGKRVFYRGEKRHKHDTPFLKGRDIERYYFRTPNNFLKHDYKKSLNDTIDMFRFSSNFLEIIPKIIYRQTSNKITANIDNQSIYLDKTVHLIVPKQKGKSLNLRFILALLNSSLFNYFYKYISQERKGRTFAQVKTTYIKQLPIKSVPSLVQQPFITLVDKILSLKKSGPQADTNALEAEIDQMVYKLYDLTEDEMAVVEERKNIV